MKIVERPSPNYNVRGHASIDMLVLHYTGMKSAEDALAKLCDPTAQVSAHYTIGENGVVYAHVAEELRAWHAGISCWAGTRDVNACSIGIELVNPGHAFGYVPFAEAQIAALIELARGIISRHPIPAARVLGHSDVAPTRKLDPGELFPWARLAQIGIGLWPDVPGKSDLGAEALARYGYDSDAPREKVIAAFQRHFRPSYLTGTWDDGCGAILASLLAKFPATGV